MNEFRGRFFGGLALILMGAVFLGVNLGILPQFDEFLWASFMGILSLLFFITYFTSGIRSWGWLFPATIFASISATIFLSSTGANGAYGGALVMAGVAIPFWVALTLGRKNWWALIPAGILTIIAGIVLLSSTALGDDFIGGIFMVGLGIIFITIYFMNREQWWAVIPGGVTATIGFTAVASEIQMPGALSDRLVGGVFFGGLALTFAVLWLLREKHNTGWGRYPAIPLGLLSLIWLTIGSDIDMFWPVIMIGAGVYILLRQRN